MYLREAFSIDVLIFTEVRNYVHIPYCQLEKQVSSMGNKKGRKKTERRGMIFKSSFCLFATTILLSGMPRLPFSVRVWFVSYSCDQKLVARRERNVERRHLAHSYLDRDQGGEPRDLQRHSENSS